MILVTSLLVTVHGSAQNPTIFTTSYEPLCEGLCKTGQWLTYTINTTISLVKTGGDNRPISADDVCNVTIVMKKRVCLGETQKAQVSIVIESVCTDCPVGSASDLLGSIITRALVVDDPFGIRQTGINDYRVSFSTSRCWSTYECSNGRICISACLCLQTEFQTNPTPGICVSCCLNEASIYVDDECNVSVAITRRDAYHPVTGDCGSQYIVQNCQGSSFVQKIQSCIETCPIFHDHYEKEGGEPDAY